MDTHDDAIEALATLSQHASLMSYAILTRDYDEARVHLAWIAVSAADQSQAAIVVVARGLARVLGERGAIPGVGYGAGVLELAEALDLAQADLLAR